MNSNRFCNFLVIVVVVGLGLTPLVLSTSENDIDQPAAKFSLESARSRFRLARVEFNFDQFKLTFNKVYHNIAEDLARRKLMLARAIRACISSIKYKFRKSSYYLAINHMSDWTPDELDMITNKQICNETLHSFEERKVRSKRDTSQASMKHQQQQQQHQQDNFGTKIIDYLASVGSLMFAPKSQTPGQIDSVVESTNWSNPGDPGDEVYFDHRASRCLFVARDQAKCGCCYAFATITLAEWLHCRQTGHLVAFSEQYLVDCSRDAGNDGCRGGTRYWSAQFVRDYGLELRQFYPYVGREGRCPYDRRKLAANQLGAIRMDQLQYEVIHLDQFEGRIGESPLYVGISSAGQHQGFFEYGGGVVADGLGCTETANHAMVLVGHGREDGHEYWLLRNSFSVKWGERGHYKLAKSAASRCIRPASGLALAAPGDGGRSFNVTPQVNRLNNRATVKLHYIKTLLTKGK